MNVRVWLADVPWELVVWQNSQLCEARKAHHGPTSDGYELCRTLWDAERLKPMSLDQMVDLCRKCHRLAPFTNYNGNTFAAIARAIVDGLDISGPTAAIARSLAGHIVAGVASDEEVRAFREFCASLG
jgi:hypothetical protein